MSGPADSPGFGPPPPLRPPAEPGSEDGEGAIVQQLPPLQGVPFSDRGALARFYAAEASSLAGLDPAAWPAWSLGPGLPAEARERLLDWVRDAARRSRRPALELGAGPGVLLRELALAGIDALGLELDLGRAALARRAGLWAAADADRRAAAEASLRTSQPIAWWAGPGAPPPAAPAARRHRALPVVAGDAVQPPFLPGRFGCVVAALVLHHVSEWGDALKAWAALLAPGGTLAIATPAEKDQDAPGFLSALGRTLLPGVVTGYPRSQDLTWVLGSAGLGVDAVSVFRVRRTFAELEAEARAAARALGAGGSRGADAAAGAGDAFRALVAEASESLRALYEIDEEGMSWRYLLVKATRPQRSAP